MRDGRTSADEWRSILPPRHFWYFSAALAGFVDSIAGGGGLIALPAYFAAGLPAHSALATNKFSGFLGTLTATLRYGKARRLNFRVGLVAVAGALVGSSAGSQLALWLSETVIHSVVLILTPLVLVFFLFQDRLGLSRTPGAETGAIALKSLGIGCIVGAYDGFYGPGTGAFLALAFYWILGLDLVSSSATARLTNVASNAGALAVFLLHSKVLFPLGLFTALGGIAGSALGSSLALKKGERNHSTTDGRGAGAAVGYGSLSAVGIRLLLPDLMFTSCTF